MMLENASGILAYCTALIAGGVFLGIHSRGLLSMVAGSLAWASAIYMLGKAAGAI